MSKLMVTIALVVLSIGCTKMTTFEGSPRVQNGRAGCERKCASQGLLFAGMVFVGEYSDACVCQLPGANQSNVGVTERAASSGATASAVAAVVTAKRIADEQARRQAQQAALR